MSTVSCQQIRNPKAFKGKGAIARQAREAEQRLTGLIAQMEELKQRSREIRSRSFALELYRRNAADVVLRWRLTTGKHTTWAAIRPMLRRLPASIQRWYIELQLSAVLLNAHAALARAEARKLRGLLREWDDLQQL